MNLAERLPGGVVRMEEAPSESGDSENLAPEASETSMEQADSHLQVASEGLGERAADRQPRAALQNSEGTTPLDDEELSEHDAAKEGIAERPETLPAQLTAQEESPSMQLPTWAVFGEPAFGKEEWDEDEGEGEGEEEEELGDSDEPMARWCCEACTFHNLPSASTCEMCFTERPLPATGAPRGGAGTGRASEAGGDPFESEMRSVSQGSAEQGDVHAPCQPAQEATTAADQTYSEHGAAAAPAVVHAEVERAAKGVAEPVQGDVEDASTVLSSEVSTPPSSPDGSIGSARRSVLEMERPAVEETGDAMAAAALDTAAGSATSGVLNDGIDDDEEDESGLGRLPAGSTMGAGELHTTAGSREFTLSDDSDDDDVDVGGTGALVHRPRATSVQAVQAPMAEASTRGSRSVSAPEVNVPREEDGGPELDVRHGDEEKDAAHDVADSRGDRLGSAAQSDLESELGGVSGALDSDDDGETISRCSVQTREEAAEDDASGAPDAAGLGRLPSDAAGLGRLPSDEEKGAMEAAQGEAEAASSQRQDGVLVRELELKTQMAGVKRREAELEMREAQVQLCEVQLKAYDPQSNLVKQLEQEKLSYEADLEDARHMTLLVEGRLSAAEAQLALVQEESAALRDQLETREAWQHASERHGQRQEIAEVVAAAVEAELLRMAPLLLEQEDAAAHASEVAAEEALAAAGAREDADTAERCLMEMAEVMECELLQVELSAGERLSEEQAAAEHQLALERVQVERLTAADAAARAELHNLRTGLEVQARQTMVQEATAREAALLESLEQHGVQLAARDAVLEVQQSARSEIEALQASEHRANAALVELEADAEEQLGLLRSSESEQREIVRRLRHQVDESIAECQLSMETSKTELQSEIARLKMEASECATESSLAMGVARTEMSAAEQEVQDVRAAASQLQAKYAQLRSELDEASIAEKQSESHGAKLELLSMQLRVQDQDEVALRLRADVQRHEETCAAAAAQVERLESQRPDLGAEHARVAGLQDLIEVERLEQKALLRAEVQRRHAAQEKEKEAQTEVEIQAEMLTEHRAHLQRLHADLQLTHAATVQAKRDNDRHLHEAEAQAEVETATAAAAVRQREELESALMLQLEELEGGLAAAQAAAQGQIHQLDLERSEATSALQDAVLEMGRESLRLQEAVVEADCMAA
ncbi:hypothetical protein CYMTET_51737, partial [Cymbomonas tetramitiformis]